MRAELTLDSTTSLSIGCASLVEIPLFTCGKSVNSDELFHNRSPFSKPDDTHGGKPGMNGG